MIGKKTRPVIGKLMTGTVFSGNRPGNMEVGGTSPRTPLESKVLSPRGFLNFDMGGVGLGIVAALEKSCHGEIPASKIPGFYCRNPIRSDPIPVNSPTGSSRRYEDSSGSEDETDSSEEYTFVTRHRQNRSYTRVYRDGGECVGYKLAGGKGKTNQRCIFDISPARFGDSTAYPPSDFLSSCHLCKKKLHGKDIYIYRGEKAFCSAECRYREIGMEERREKYYCSSEVARTTAVEVSNSPYTNGQMFTTGIFAI